jgi:hypothetical protein
MFPKIVCSEELRTCLVLIYYFFQSGNLAPPIFYLFVFSFVLLQMCRARQLPKLSACCELSAESYIPLNPLLHSFSMDDTKRNVVEADNPRIPHRLFQRK